MGVVRRLYACLLAGLLALFVAKGLNVPVWRDWDTGDQSDFVITAVALIWVLTGPRRQA